MKRQNLLYIMCDELRWCDVGCYGAAHTRRDGSPLTPNLDRLAQAGTRFETAVSNCPVCVPARSVVLSGQYARQCQGTTTNPSLGYHTRDSLAPRSGWLFDAYAPPTRAAFPNLTLPELLKQAGYHTRAIGKWHVEAWPHQLGFDRYLIPRSHHAHSGQLFTEDGGVEFSPPGFSVDFEADRVEQFLEEEALADKPWFLYYNISPPHMPLADMPEHYLSLVDPTSIDLRANVPADFDFDEHLETVRIYLWDFRRYLSHMPHTQDVSITSLEELIALYLGATAWVDDTVGRTLTSLDAAGMADDTMVVFTSDHGDMLGSQGIWGKGSLWEESYRVPMLIRGPAVRTGTVRADVGSLIDVAPTLLGQAHVEVPDHMSGRDLLAAGACDFAGGAVIEASDGSKIARRTQHRLEVFDLSDAGAHATWGLEHDPLQERSDVSRAAGVSPETASFFAEWHRDHPSLSLPEAGG